MGKKMGLRTKVDKYLKIDKNDCNSYSNCDASLYKN